MKKTLRVLNVEDSESDSMLLKAHLSRAGYDAILERVDTPEEMQAALETDHWDVVLADYSMPRFSAIQALGLLRKTRLDIPLIVISGTIGEELAVETMRAGAHDYVMKDKLARLIPAIERELTEAESRSSRRKAEEMLDEQRIRLNNIVASVPGVVFEAWRLPGASTQQIDFVSDYVETMLGYTVEEWLATPNFWLQIVHPDDRERIAREAADNFARGANRAAMQFRWCAKDGHEIWAEATTAVIKDDQGRPIGMRGVALDITERGRAEEALRESKERYRLLFESNPDAAYVLDAETLIFLAVNDAAVKRYGYSRDELASMTIKHLRPTEEVPLSVENLVHGPHKIQNDAVSGRRKKDGSIIQVETTNYPLVFAGRQAHVVLERDITDRKALEQQFRQAQKMEAVGQLAGGIAHDFNNLLTVINGYSELVMERLPPEDPLRGHIDQVRKAGQRAASLTRQLLAFSRKQVMQPRVLHPNSVILEVEKMLCRLIGENIELRTALSADVGNIRADPGQIEQVIVNLVVNARDAMPNGGRLTIETSNVELDAEFVFRHIGSIAGSYVSLAITDTGSGMTAETQTRMFEPFFTTKEVGKGTGLGLPTVYGIVKQSEGSIWVDSEVGVGTTVKVYLPRVTEPRRESKRPAESSEPVLRGNETILIAEDDDMVRNLTLRVLEGDGYKVLSAANGSEAVALCEGFKGFIHLLITDVVMPGLGGHDLAARVVELKPKIRILYMSGYTDNAIVRQGILDERTPFIQKPFSPRDLIVKVREILSKSIKSSS